MFPLRYACSMAINLSDYETGAPYRGDYSADLAVLQERLARIHTAHIAHGRRAIVLFEGLDGAGKGGAIRRLAAGWDPRAFRAWAIAAPTGEERARHFLWRFWNRLPAAGEIALFDRSWYGRLLGERIEGRASEAEWRRACDEINEFEAQQSFDGTAIVKLFLHVAPGVREARLRARLADPWKRGKVTAQALESLAGDEEHRAVAHEMFAHTDTRWAPWRVIDGNDKQACRIAALAAVADALEPAAPAQPPALSPEIEARTRHLFQEDG